MALWTKYQGGQIVSADKDEAKNLIMQELGIALELKKEESMASAIAEPSKFITDRAKNIKIAAANAGEAFTNYNSRLLEAGVPSDIARQTALQFARANYDAWMNIENLTHPGYAQAIGKTVVDREQKEGVRDLYLDRKAYKKQVIAKYKAKKAKKTAKKAGQAGNP